MIIRLEDSFINLAQQLVKPFTEAEKHQLAGLISDRKTYDQLRFIISDQEREKEQSKPTLIELCNIGERYFALNIIIMKIKCKITYHCLLENYYLLYLLFR